MANETVLLGVCHFISFAGNPDRTSKFTIGLHVNF